MVTSADGSDSLASPKRLALVGHNSFTNNVQQAQEKHLSINAKLFLAIIPQ